MTSLADLRKSYTLGSLDAADVDRNPFRQFDDLVRAGGRRQAARAEHDDARHGRRARPAFGAHRADQGRGRTGVRVLHQLRKPQGPRTRRQPAASLLFYWIELERQVRIEGSVAKTSAAESDAYYASRPLGSRIGAWASEQSQVIESRAALEARETRSRARNTAITRRARRTGAATGWCPTPSNSGKAGRRGCTTASCTRARTLGATGASSGVA